jgi:uncharacterized Zn finger protein (UPF0148 family)
MKKTMFKHMCSNCNCAPWLSKDAIDMCPKCGTIDNWPYWEQLQEEAEKEMELIDRIHAEIYA